MGRIRPHYLRRTAHFSGAPYGSVDISFLVDQATLDMDGKFCFGPKAVRAADHLLISRYYDYMQVAFHKTVAALEWSLVTALRACLEFGLIEGSAQSVDKMIKSGAWVEFDDQSVVGHFRTLSKQISNSTKPEELVLKDHLNGIINRRAPKMIAAWEEVSLTNESAHYARTTNMALAAVREISDECGIDRARFHVWREKKAFSSVAGSVDLKNLDEDEASKAVQILNQRSDKAELLVKHPEALMRQLADRQFTGVRVYFLGEGGVDDGGLREKLCLEFEKRMGTATSV